MSVIRRLLFPIRLALNTIWWSVLAIRGACVTRQLIRHFFYIRTGWAHSILRAANVEVEIQGQSCFDSSAAYVVVANHSSYFDVFSLFAYLPFKNLRILAKHTLFRIPLFGRAMRSGGVLPIVRENHRVAVGAIQEIPAHLKGGASVILFPEGTRSYDGKLGRFKKGAFVLAIEAQVPILPVVVRNARYIMPRGSIFARSGRIQLKYLNPVDTSGMNYQDRTRLLEHVWEQMNRDLNGE